MTDRRIVHQTASAPTRTPVGKSGGRALFTLIQTAGRIAARTRSYATSSLGTREEADMEARVISKVSRRIVPFVALCYFLC